MHRAGRPALCLRLEYNEASNVLGKSAGKSAGAPTSRDLPRSAATTSPHESAGGRSGNWTVINCYRESECVHAADPGGRPAFPRVVYQGQASSNHLFNETPLLLSGADCERLVRECLKHASHPSGETYSHLPDPTKGEVNCVVYAVRFAAPVMGATSARSPQTSRDLPISPGISPHLPV